MTALPELPPHPVFRLPTLEQARAMSLEDLFLKLTGGPREHHLDAVLGR